MKILNKIFVLVTRITRTLFFVDIFSPKSFKKGKCQSWKQKAYRWDNCIKPRLNYVNSVQIKTYCKVGKNRNYNFSENTYLPSFICLNVLVSSLDFSILSSRFFISIISEVYNEILTYPSLCHRLGLYGKRNSICNNQSFKKE